jgi:dihydroorotase
MILIKDAYVIDPAQPYEGPAELLIEQGRIRQFAPKGRLRRPPKAQVVEAQGLWVLPGLIDMHTHLREPGFEHKETIKTGTLAALRGGFTTVCAMANTNPVNDNAGITEFILRKAQAEGHAKVLPVGAISKGQKGQELAEMALMKDAGCVAFSDDGHPVQSALLMRRALEYAAGLDTLVITHAEDPALSEGGVMNEGLLALRMGLRGIPAQAEAVAVFRDLALAALTGGRLHVAHVSTAEAVNLIRQGKDRGLRISAETCPHYFSLTEEAVEGYNTNAKVNPPLRTEKDLQAIREALRDGTLDVIATDHAPHAPEEKAQQFDQAPSGASGLETALALSFALVREEVLTPMQMVEKFTTNPARVLGIEPPALREGAEANLVIFDPERAWTVNPREFLSKGKNTPFEGKELQGQVVATVFRGDLRKWL